jgi:hypothetical protein
MEIACTDAANEEEAARKADAIRQEILEKIPNLEPLFTLSVVK